MVVGNTRESMEDIRQRHIEETKEDQAGWEKELELAVKRNDTQFMRYCQVWISICKNTLDKLNNFEII